MRVPRSDFAPTAFEDLMVGVAEHAVALLGEQDASQLAVDLDVRKASGGVAVRVASDGEVAEGFFPDAQGVDPMFGGGEGRRDPVVRATARFAIQGKGGVEVTLASATRDKHNVPFVLTARSDLGEATSDSDLPCPGRRAGGAHSPYCLTRRNLAQCALMAATAAALPSAFGDPGTMWAPAAAAGCGEYPPVTDGTFLGATSRPFACTHRCA